jgi:uncharacterized protein (DUF302 family)
MTQIKAVDIKMSFLVKMESWKLAVTVMPCNTFISKETEKAMEVTYINRNTKKEYKIWYPKSVIVSIIQ